MSKKDIWIIIPAYNEQQYILKVLSKLLEKTSNVLVVDDGSDDRTFELVTHVGVSCLRHAVNLGKGAAMKTGCDYAFGELGAEAVIFVDSDDQHDTAELPFFYEGLEKGYDVILGYRVLRENMPTIRRWGNQFSSYLVWIIFGIMVRDVPCGYRAFTKDAYQKLRWESSRYEVETEIIVRIARNNLSYLEVPVSTVYHDADKGFSLLDGLVILIKLIHWRVSLFL